MSFTFIRRAIAIASFVVYLSTGFATSATHLVTINQSPEFKHIRTILSQPEKAIDLAEARLAIEKLLNPKVDVNNSLETIEAIVKKIKAVPRFSTSTEGKLNGIVQYLYHPGAWNNFNPYQYDFDDPLGTAKPENSLLSNYLITRKGNCVSMPLLVLILGERLGLEMNLSTAPLHLFVRLKDKGNYFNFEATAGGLKHDSSYVNDFMISPDALKNGVYLHNLTRKQTVAVMLTELAKYYSNKSQLNSDFDKAFELTGLILKHHPNNVSAMLIRGNTWRNILARDLAAFRTRRVTMTRPIKKHFDELLARNLEWYSKAETLGWREPPKDYNDRYLKMVNEARKNYE